MHLRRLSQDLQSKGWAKSVTDLKQKILRNVERAGSLALYTEQESSPFGLIKCYLFGWKCIDIVQERMFQIEETFFL